MHAALHRQDRNVVYFAADESSAVSLHRRARKARNLVIRNSNSVFEVVRESAQSTAEHERNARLYCQTRANRSCCVFCTFVKTCACQSFNHYSLCSLLFLIRYAQRARRPRRADKARSEERRVGKECRTRW